jgi:O-antigen ligase
MIIRDCIRRRGVSWMIWIPTILAMILASRPPSRWLQGRAVSLGIENANDLQTSTADQTFFLIILGCAFAVAVFRRAQWSKVIANNLPLMMFYLYFAISIMWSSDPMGSTKRIVKDFGLLFAAGVVFTEKDPLQALRSIFVRSGYLLIPLSVIFIKYYPNFGRAYSGSGEMMFTGVTTQKNSLGEMVLILSLFLVWDYLEARRALKVVRFFRVPWELLFLLVMGLWLLRLSQSKTSLFCTAVSMLLLVRGKPFMSKAISRFVLVGSLLLPFFVFFSQRFSDVISPMLHAIGRDTTFTGRTEIWSHITWDTVNPFIGAGYWNFWGGPGGLAFNEAIHEVIPNAHDGYVDIYLDGGLVGLALLFFFLFFYGWRISRRISNTKDENRFQRMKFAVLIAVIIFNLSESTYARIGLIWFTTLLMICEFPIKAALAQPIKRLNAVRQRRFQQMPAALPQR